MLAMCGFCLSKAGLPQKDLYHLYDNRLAVGAKKVQLSNKALAKKAKMMYNYKIVVQSVISFEENIFDDRCRL